MKNRRKQLTIPRKYLNNFILVPLCLILIVFNLVILSNIFITNTTLLAFFQPQTIVYIAIFELILIFVIVFSGSLTAHRIAGPMISLDKGLKSLGAGDLTASLQFRKNDFNENIANSFNENIENLRKQVVMIKELTEKLEQELPANHSAQEILEQLKEELNYLKTQ